MSRFIFFFYQMTMNLSFWNMSICKDLIHPNYLKQICLTYSGTQPCRKCSFVICQGFERCVSFCSHNNTMEWYFICGAHSIEIRHFLIKKKFDIYYQKMSLLFWIFHRTYFSSTTLDTISLEESSSNKNCKVCGYMVIQSNRDIHSCWLPCYNQSTTCAWPRDSCHPAQLHRAF